MGDLECLSNVSVVSRIFATLAHLTCILFLSFLHTHIWTQARTYACTYAHTIMFFPLVGAYLASIMSRRQTYQIVPYLYLSLFLSLSLSLYHSFLNDVQKRGKEEIPKGVRDTGCVGGKREGRKQKKGAHKHGFELLARWAPNVRPHCEGTT